VERIVELVPQVPSVDVIDNLNNSPIYYAILCGHLAAVQVLFKYHIISFSVMDDLPVDELCCM